MSADLFLGADTGGTGVKFIITDPASAVLHEGDIPTNPDSGPDTMSRLADVARDLLGGDLDRLQGVGLACAGIVNPRTGWLGRSPNLPGWENNHLGQTLSAAFADKPVVLANDVNAALYGEYRQGAGQGCDNLIMIALGTGVGGGVLLNGKLVLGSHFGAGEIGHMILDPRGPVCTCGSQGCLEAWAGSVALLKAAHRLARDICTPAFANLVLDRGESLTPRDLSILAETGDPTAIELFAAAGRRLGQAVGNLINLLDPDQVIIGGGVAKAGDLILGPCRDMIPGIVLGAEAAKVPVVPAGLGHLAAAVGAACLAREAGATP